MNVFGRLIRLIRNGSEAFFKFISNRNSPKKAAGKTVRENLKPGSPSEEMFLYQVLDSLEDAVFVINRDRKVIFWNKEAERMTGVRKKDIIGSHESRCSKAFYGIERPLLSDFLLSKEMDITGWFDYVEKKGGTLYAEIFISSLYGGKGAYVWISTRKMHDFKGNFIGVIESVLNLDALGQSEREIWYAGFHDKLTGLFNRAYAETEIKRLDSERQLPISLIMGDVDNLKLTNDIFGHQVGDELLIDIAHIFRKICRNEDIISRWGGDEFVILLPQTDQKTAFEIVKRIDLKAQSHVSSRFLPSLAMGVATKSDPRQDISKVLAEAEEMMYVRKFKADSLGRATFIEHLKNELMKFSYEDITHIERLQKTASCIGGQMGLSGDQLKELDSLAVFHDIGVVGIPKDILFKPHTLTDLEWKTVTRHTEMGYQIAKSVFSLIPIAPYILCHHEKWDGSGYPQGLKADSIPLLSRILSVADAYDAMTHGRPYKKPISTEEAKFELSRCAGSHFDPKVVQNFCRTG
jgi:diguanylate cyclase (GGDEF)-like protein/PAS domain S-box-containing protein